MKALLVTRCGATQLTDIPEKTPPLSWRVPMVQIEADTGLKSLPDPNHPDFEVRVFHRRDHEPCWINDIAVWVYLEGK